MISCGSMTEGEQYVELPLVYVGIEDVPVLFANQFLVQHEQNEFLLTVGQLQPPPLLGSPEEKMEQLKTMTYVPVKVVARFGMTRQRLAQLVEVLQTNLQNYDEKEGRKG